MCETCGTIKTFTPWRSLTDSAVHYRIFLIIRDFTNKQISKSEAKALLTACDLTDLEEFIPEIKVMIKALISEENVC